MNLRAVSLASNNFCLIKSSLFKDWQGDMPSVMEKPIVALVLGNLSVNLHGIWRLKKKNVGLYCQKESTSVFYDNDLESSFVSCVDILKQ